MICPLGIVLMCQTAPIIKAPTKKYAMVEIEPGARIHVEFEDKDFYIAVSDEKRKIFRGREYYGVAMAVRKKNDISNQEISLHEIYVHSEVAIIDNHEFGTLDVYGKDADAYWLVNNRGSVWCQFHDRYKWLENQNQEEFAAEWRNYTEQNIGLNVELGKIVF